MHPIQLKKNYNMNYVDFFSNFFLLAIEFCFKSRYNYTNIFLIDSGI